MVHQLPIDLVNDTQGLLGGIANWAYNVTNGMFWTFSLAAFCMILWMATLRHGQERAIGFAGITGLIGALFLATLKLMPWWIASIFILMGALGTTYMILNRE